MLVVLYISSVSTATAQLQLVKNNDNKWIIGAGSLFNNKENQVGNNSNLVNNSNQWIIALVSTSAWNRFETIVEEMELMICA